MVTPFNLQHQVRECGYVCVFCKGILREPKFRPNGKKCQVELDGYAYEGLYSYGLPQSGRTK
jgi:hypothetical protein